jgi:nicotinamidase-related amidase
VAFTTVLYDDPRAEAGAFLDKVPALARLARGSRWVEVDPRLGRRRLEPIYEKKYASAFFGTSLASWLVAQRVDTVVVAGFTTSGCVRASVVDALQHGFRPVVPVDCIGDRSAPQHQANLVDIEAKYGDVVPLADVVAALKRQRGTRQSAE